MASESARGVGLGVGALGEEELGLRSPSLSLIPTRGAGGGRGEEEPSVSTYLMTGMVCPVIVAEFVSCLAAAVQCESLLISLGGYS